MTQNQEEEDLAEQFEKVHQHLDYVDRTLQQVADTIEEEIDDAMDFAGLNVSYDIDQGHVEAQINLEQVVARLNCRLDPPFYATLNPDNRLVVGDIREEIDTDLMFDADKLTSSEDRQRRKAIKKLVATVEEDYEEGAPVEQVLKLAQYAGLARDDAEDDILHLKTKGEVYEPSTDNLRTT